MSPQRLALETSNFVRGSAMRSLSLVMSECLLSGRGQGHVSNFYIVDLENFATASSRFLFCSLAVLDPRVGHTMDVGLLSPFIPVLCHSD